MIVVAIEVKQGTDQFARLGQRVAFGLVQIARRPVDELVGQPVAERFEHFLRRLAARQALGRTRQFLLAQAVPARLVWSTRSPRATYGDALVDEILAVQPDALIWDTNDQGRPHLVRLAHEAYRDFDAEAVICISNKKLTWQVVTGMESRGIPAYGAIWDS